VVLTAFFPRNRSRIGSAMATKGDVTVTCMHCGNGGASRFPAVRDRTDYSCPICGNYSVSSMMQKIINNGHADPRRGQFVVGDGRRYLRPSSR